MIHAANANDEQMNTHKCTGCFSIPSFVTDKPRLRQVSSGAAKASHEANELAAALWGDASITFIYNFFKRCPEGIVVQVLQRKLAEQTREHRGVYRGGRHSLRFVLGCQADRVKKEGFRFFVDLSILFTAKLQNI